jgi:hypothetical protein
MAKLVLTDVTVSLASTDISANVASVTLTSSAAEVETTAFGQGAVTRVGGLKDNSVTLAIHNDYPTVENLVYPLIGSTTTIVLTPNGTAVGSANPSFTASVLITEWSSINGAVGELASLDVTWPISGTITKSFT